MAAWRRGGLTQKFMRAINVQFRTKFSAGLLPPLRQTACCAFGILPRVLSVSFHCRSSFFRLCFTFRYIVGLCFLFYSPTLSLCNTSVTISGAGIIYDVYTFCCFTLFTLFALFVFLSTFTYDNHSATCNNFIR